MTEFEKKINDETSKQIFNNILPIINELSYTYINNAKKLFSDEKYINSRKLSINWLPTSEIKAFASIRSDNTEEHSINISYGLIHKFYQDSSLFFHLCSNTFKDKLYDDFFEKIDFGQGREHIIPLSLFSKFDKNLNIETKNRANDIQFIFNEILLTWLYLHEQAHLFQGHGMVAQDYFEEKNCNIFLNFDEFNINLSNELSEQEAWVSHAFELSADFEALNLTMQFIMKKSLDLYGKLELSLSLFWVFVCSLAYIFEKFYGKQRESHNGIAKGTHPDPVIRFKYIHEHISNLLDNEYTIKLYEEGKTRQDYENVLNHALKTVNLFFKILYTEENTITPLFQLNCYENTELDYKYIKGINTTWKELRPIVMKYHFGYGDVSVMPIYDTSNL